MPPLQRMLDCDDVMDADRNALKGRLLVASNGHGEDDIACKVLACLLDIDHNRPAVDAWPIVGEGRAYRDLGIQTVGPRNTLPSAGFATLDWRLMAADLRSGWIGTHWTQYRFARQLHSRYDAIIGVGDIIPLLVSRCSNLPLFFIACAKSAYYEAGDGYTYLEKQLMRRCCLAVFPRDRLTSERLAKSGVANEYLGNPMMDGLTPGTRIAPDDPKKTWIALLPGSRSDAFDNLFLLLAAAARISEKSDQPASLGFAIAVHRSLSLQQISETVAVSGSKWSPVDRDHWGGTDVDAIALAHGSGSRVLIMKDRFADILHTASLAIGMAGTANEQAVGLGIPLITVPSTGVQGRNYARMKMKFFGESAVMAQNDAEKIADVSLSLLQDAAACHRMGLAGRERMGQPGASKAIGGRIQEILSAQRSALY